jgi:signal transduction histidine kinase/ActR/RegA family two-component response regulator
MALLAAVFTLATIATTFRIHHTIEASLSLRFENRDLIEELQIAKRETDALNQALELRVQERTAELEKSTEQLRAEIVRRENMEEELLRARKLESLGVLAGGIAHDFNNFLTVIQGTIEVAKYKLDPKNSRRMKTKDSVLRSRPIQLLDQVLSTCKRAAFLSSQLLTFAKGGSPVRQLVSVAELVTDAVQLARAGTSISIQINLPENLHSARVDPGQISQALQDILLNARQAMPSGGVIEVSAENVAAPEGAGTDPHLRIAIRDYGCGIPAEVLPRIFDPYFTTKGDGRGLGLATAYSIIAKHGGSISVESKVREGTVFTIDLPASRETPAPPPPIFPGFETGDERILVMDDEESLRRLLKTVLTDFGYEVDTAGDGAEAVALYEREMLAGRGFDAVLLDLTVSGGMGGVETAAKLKEIDPAAKLIVSSGYSDATVMSEYRKYGFDAVLPKPWNAAELGQLLRRLLVVDPDRKRG